MIFRQASPHEINLLFSEGYKEWQKNRTFEQYCADNAKEDAYGSRYVLDLDNEIVSSLILLDLKDIAGIKAYGIGSVLTPKIHAGKGYATHLINYCLKLKEAEGSYILLFSDISPDFYKKFNFRILPPQLQKYEKSICMAYCDDENWHTLQNCTLESIPDYF